VRRRFLPEICRCGVQSRSPIFQRTRFRPFLPARPFYRVHPTSDPPAGAVMFLTTSPSFSPFLMEFIEGQLIRPGNPCVPPRADFPPLFPPPLPSLKCQTKGIFFFFFFLHRQFDGKLLGQTISLFFRELGDQRTSLRIPSTLSLFFFFAERRRGARAKALCSFSP